MTNAQIAEVFGQIAALLEIKGDNPFKVRAYQRASDAVRSLGQELSDLYDESGIPKISGVGSSIATKIEELLQTGECSAHQDLLAEFPETVFDMLEVPGVGPKTVKLLLERKAIANLEDLEQAARAGELRDVPGMGEKTEQEIVRGIENLRRYAERTNLGVAWEVAAALMDRLRAEAPVDRMEAAGSLRRMRETIGDIDILVTSDDPEAVMQSFVGLDAVAQVIAHGTTKSSVRTEAGIQADLRVVPPESFGAALQYFTGSKAHNVKLREFAVRRGIKLNEYGAFRVHDDGDERIGGRDEEEMYAVLDLPWMPPEIREDRGEVEAAREGKLPALLTRADISGDLHMHTTWSDGHHTVEELARRAKELGYRYIAVTDHSPSEPVANGLSVERLRQRREEVEAARKAVRGIAILEGTEVDIKRDGGLDYPGEVLAELDFVVASVHSGWKMERGAMTERIAKAIENPWVDCIGHPTGRLLGQREPYELDMEAVLQAAARHGVAMEINSYPDRLDLNDVHARRAKELGVKLLINTDAHSADHLDLIRFGVATARRGWIEAGDVLNTLTASELRKRLRRSGAKKKRRGGSARRSRKRSS